ncbi:acyltransferase [Methylopila sp. M107]|uniref:acyltransferase family protein n=1 Tax=Methylopila sp. M107 TaxID=1101190 RepID=UPI0003A05C6C|nr:acyltransferase [Methylopila sp. M107]
MTPTLAECLDRRRNDLAAVRVLAATAVLHAHAWYVSTRGLKTEDFFQVLAFTLDFHAVHAFFILSGLLLTRSLMAQRDLTRFVVARLVRYVPGVFVAALFAALVVGPLVTTLPLEQYFASGVAKFVLKIATLADVDATLPGVFAGNPQPGTLFIPLWTIHYELVFAAALGVAGAVRLLRFRTLVVLGIVAAAAVNIVWFWNGEEHLRLGTPHHLVRFGSTFGIGVALAIFADRIPVSNRLLLGLATCSIPLAFSHFAALTGMLLIAYAIVCIGFAGGPVAAWLARPGAWSYGFYVWGFLVEQTIIYAVPGASGWTVFFVALPIALFAGWLSWRFVERPCIARTDAITAALRAPFARAGDASVAAKRD